MKHKTRKELEIERETYYENMWAFGILCLILLGWLFISIHTSQEGYKKLSQCQAENDVLKTMTEPKLIGNPNVEITPTLSSLNITKNIVLQITGEECLKQIPCPDGSDRNCRININCEVLP